MSHNSVLEYRPHPAKKGWGLLVMVVVFLFGVWVGMLLNTVLYHRYKVPVHSYQYQYDQRTYESIPEILDELNRNKNPDPDKQ